MSLIVSLTSTKARLPVLRHTLLSLTAQSYKPDKIILHLSRESYLADDGIESLPQWLEEIIALTLLEVKWVKNTGPYRKLLPVLASAKDDDLIVTCDDDVIYGQEWLKLLVVTAQEFPDAIGCGRARRPVTNIFGKTQSYLHWPLVKAGHGHNLLPIGVGGIVYKKRLLSQKLTNSNEYLILAPKQDDLWFNAAAKMAGTPIIVAQDVDNYVHEIKTPDSLSYTNRPIKLQGWDRPLFAFVSRIVFKVKAYLGFAGCENDVALTKIAEFVDKH